MNINKIGQNIVIFLEKIIHINVNLMPIYTLEDYNFLKNIEANYEIILNELLKFEYSKFKDMNDLSVEQERIVSKRKWKVLFLKIYGKDINRNILSFPRTTALLKNRKIKTAMFSRLEPNSHILPHRGPYKGVLRYHLGLIIPKEYNECGIRINNKDYHWQIGESLLFDDTYIHEAWNNTEESRIILFLDIERNLQFPFNILNKFVLYVIKHSPFVNGIHSKS